MRSKIILLLIVTLVALSGGQVSNPGSDLLSYSFENNGAEGYKYAYSTRDQSRSEKGSFINGIWTVTGHVKWNSPEGVPYDVYYVADDKGYRTEEAPTTEPQFIAVGLGAGTLASLAG